ncbi:MAG: imidazolonepropionase, partial [Bacteroidota bacterium]
MSILFKHIQQLLQVRPNEEKLVRGQAMAELPLLENAYLLVENGRIASFGQMEDCPDGGFDQEIDARGRLLLPSWCDSHTHLVYAGNRIQEFEWRLQGRSYAEIAEAGGGILNSAKKLQVCSEEDLYQQSQARLETLLKLGTGAIEIKSGYGLSMEAELKMLRVIRRLSQTYNLPVRSTLLACHALPQEFKGRKEEYVTQVIDELLPRATEENLVDFVDIFCEKGYFDLLDTQRMMEAGNQLGLPAKIHVNQFHALGGVEVAVQLGALSVDHLEVLNDADLQALRGGETMPVALPACSFFLDLPYTPARKIIEAGLPLALASDFNPGSAPTGNMNWVVATASVKMGLTPAEAINAATLNGAYAMGLVDEVGSIAVGKRANLLLTKPLPNYAAL